MTYPKDIESGIQWRVRHRAPQDPEQEIVRVLTEVQARSVEKRLSALEPVVEARLIAVGEWGDPEEVEAELVSGDDESD